MCYYVSLVLPVDSLYGLNLEVILFTFLLQSHESDYYTQGHHLQPDQS